MIAFVFILGLFVLLSLWFVALEPRSWTRF